MNCPSCGSPNETNRKFCGECGTRLVASCPACGAGNPPSVRFCGECGTRLSADGPAGAPAGGVAPSAPARPGGDARVAERRLVSILFADLVGFTTIAEGRDAEAVRDLLTTYFDQARTIIERYGGTVEKFIGDAVMAVWGAPQAHEDDAERAVRAALDVVDAVRTLAPGVEARAGVLTGEAAVTLGATDQGMVAGDLVNTASRLQSVAAPGTVLVGEATRRAAGEAIAFEAAGPQALKGKESPVAAWQALRVLSRRKGAGRSDRLEAPFVGRDAELRLLKDLFHATARERRARLVSITGQAGIGKSRLAWEFLKYVDGVVEGVWWHEGRSPAYGEGVTFWALGEMIRSRAGLLETDDPETTRRRIAETVATHVPDEEERRWIEPALLALLGVGEPPPGGRDELFRAWRTFFERLAATSTVALLFEDLQWADAGLLDFIDHLLEWSRGVPILIVTLARPDLLDRRPDWGAGRRNFLALGLEPLDADAMRELLAGLVPGLPSAAVRAIVGRADGIPLYAVETIRMLVADGRLRETEHGFEPTGDLGELAVPESLQALIAARLDALDPADRGLLQDAAVLGQSFTTAGLAAVSGEPAETLERRLHALTRAELLVQDIDPRSPERGMYQFVQALIREVAYSTLAKKDRRARHLAAARFFESLGEDELASALAAHYVAAYQASPEGPEGEALAVQARLALVGAAERAIGLGSPDQAMIFLGQAASVTTEPAERAAVLERLGQAARAAARTDEAEVALREAIDIRRSLGDDAATFRATLWLAEALAVSRNTERFNAVVGPVVADPPADADERDLAAMLGLYARGLSSLERWSDSFDAVERALRIAERLDLHEVLVDGLATKASILAAEGRTVEALALMGAARQLAAEHALPGHQARIINGQTLIQAARDPKAAFELELEGIDVARRAGRRDTELTLIGNAGEDAIRIGRWDWQAQELASLDIDLPINLRLLTEFSTYAVRVLRGEDDVLDAADRFIRESEDASDTTDIATSADDLRAYVALVAGHYGEAVTAWMEQASLSSINAPYALPRAGRAALLAGDATAARLALERLVETGLRGGALDMDRLAIEAGIAALEGRTDEAQRRFRDALAGWRELELPWDEAVTGWLALATLGSDDPVARAAGLESVRILRDLGAAPVLAAVERLLGPSAAADAAGPSPVGDQVPAS